MIYLTNVICKSLYDNVIGIVFYATDSEEYSSLKVFSHDMVRYGCGRCRRTYSQKKTLGRHLRFDCGQNPSFECQMCPRMFKHGYMLLKHMRRIHNIHIEKLRQRHSKPIPIRIKEEIDAEEIIIGT